MKKFFLLIAAVLCCGSVCAEQKSENSACQFLGFSVHQPYFSRPWTNRVMRKCNEEMKVVAGVSLDLSVLDDQPEQSSLGYSVGFFTPPGSDHVYGLKLSCIESYTQAVDAGISYSLLASDIWSVAGLQLALAGNAEQLYGIQCMPLFSTVGQSFYGFQFGGIGSYAEGGTGIQIGGWTSLVQDFTGLQLSGTCSFADRITQGIQLSGLVSKAEGFSGLQIAGIANLSMIRCAGLQISAMGNESPIVFGCQISLFNKANVLRGVQIGLLNHCPHGILPWMPLINFHF